MLLSSNYKSASINREYNSKPNNTMQKGIFNFLSMLSCTGVKWYLQVNFEKRMKR